MTGVQTCALPIWRRNPRHNYAKHYKIDPNLSDEDAKRAAYNIYMKHYLRCVKGIDDNLARLFAYLDETKLMDNTVIIYTGDQGFLLGEHDDMDKRWMYDESMRMPFLIRYPKTIPAGSRSNAIVENVDYGPTMLDFAGIKTPAVMQGRSFRAICETGKEPSDWKQEAKYRYWMHMAHHDNPGHVGIRTKTHKLLFHYGCNDRGQNQTPPGGEDRKSVFFFFKAEEGIRVYDGTGVQACALPIWVDRRESLFRLRPVIGHLTCFGHALTP